MRSLRFIVFLFAVVFIPASTLSAARPNILFIYLDDFGWKDTGYMGSDFYETPNIDALAQQGMIFTDAYSCSANCAPARACLLSGQYTPRHQIFNVGTRPRGKAEHRRLMHIPGTEVLDDKIVTWAETLQESGYETGLFGKWHLGSEPTTQGFDVSVERTDLPGFKGHYGPNGEYLTDVLTDRAIDFVKENQEKNWCVYLSHYAVHTPLHPKPELVPKYKSKMPGKLHNHVEMATMIQAVDDSVGRMMNVLKELALLENTVIVFSSDNGGYGPATDMDPLWGYKGSYYEGGIRVPLFVNWPGVTKADSRSSTPIIGVDIFPTLCDIARAPLPKQPQDGISLVPFLRGEKQNVENRPLFWHFPAYLQSYVVNDEQRDTLFRSRPVGAVRLGDFKLKEYFEDGHLELFNLRDDIREQKNLAETNPKKRDELHALLKNWRKNIDAPVPTQRNPEFDTEAERKAIEQARVN